MIVLIDNYDSFSYNVVQLAASLMPDIRVIRNDAMTAPDVLALEPEAVILSPGPGKPSDAGICEELIAGAPDDLAILGICLGHQAVVEAFGGTVGRARTLVHGKASKVKLDPSSRLFAGMPETTTVGRYHSLSADREALPDVLKVTAVADDGEIMAVEHISRPVYGVQFHPESILTEDGRTMMVNFFEKGGLR